PDCPAFVFGVGHVLAQHTPQVFEDGRKAFTLVVTEYVGGSVKSSAFNCLYPATRRWEKVPLPRAQSCTQFLGMCAGFSNSALLQVALEHVSLSLGPHTLTAPTTESPTSATTPQKRHKYVATRFTSTPTSVASKASTQARPYASASGDLVI
ncbi:hypothetical protein B0H13DRAFT_1520537, partial [Mycena leptocephala]